MTRIRVVPVRPRPPAVTACCHRCRSGAGPVRAAVTRPTATLAQPDPGKAPPQRQLNRLTCALATACKGIARGRTASIANEPESQRPGGRWPSGKTDSYQLDRGLGSAALSRLLRRMLCHSGVAIRLQPGPTVRSQQFQQNRLSVIACSLFGCVRPRGRMLFSEQKVASNSESHMRLLMQSTCPEPPAASCHVTP